jgi:Icc-related predicted phosphoesterase
VKIRSRSMLLALVACLTAALWSAAGMGQTTAPAEAHFFFVQITDTHLGQGNNFERTAAAVDRINALPMPIEFVAHTGDIFYECLGNAEIAQRGMAVFRGLNRPIHFLPGNHDIPHTGPRQAAEVDCYLKTVGPLSHTLETHGVVMIFFFAEPLTGKFPVPGYDAWEWLENALNEAQEKPVIIFLHTPPVKDFYANRAHPGWPSEIVSRWNELLKRHNVKAVIAGHFHRDEMHRLNGVPLFISAPIADLFGRQGSYRIYEYDNGHLTYTTQYIERLRPAASAPATASASATASALPEEHVP